MFTGVFDVNNHSKSLKCASLERFLYLFFINVNLLKVASHKYVKPKNVWITLTFDKRKDDTDVLQVYSKMP